MRAALLVALVACALVAVSAQSTAPAGPCTASAATETLCERITTALGLCNQYSTSEYNALFKIVDTALHSTVQISYQNQNFGSLCSQASTRNYFNGNLKYRADAPDYCTGGPARSNLVRQITLFLGSPNALNCRAPQFPQYTNTRTQNAIHKNMNISKVPFEYFNNALSASLGFNSLTAQGGANNLAEPDYNQFRSLLAGFGRHLVSAAESSKAKEICTQPGCPCVAGVGPDGVCDTVSSASASSVSFVALAFAAVLALLARQ